MNSQTGENLLSIKNDGDQLRVCSMDFAEGLGIQHKNLLESIRTHQNVIESEFGLIAFETRKTETLSSKGRPESLAYLTEDQALFIGTLSRNSKRVVQFKSILVKSFAEARKEQKAKQATTTPALLSVEQVILQQAHTLLEQGNLIAQLRADVDALQAKGRSKVNPHLKATPELKFPAKPASLTPLRQRISRHINEYCDHYNASQSQAYSYLYKRLYDVYGINVYKLPRASKESILDAIERHAHLDRLYSLITAELTYSEN
ncbi:Rha family transcriptional regulator [Spirosoma agri]|uniref:Rha family transcriptional regulator n=1 Tax=Spirosoma agri TaxID=1987381 RepID=A0A6M0IHW2_9BACT|nr:Rha family transcriptional regulator [Spirosoma agri]NEU67774.1 Rha family transcriptional regulator [Spirosoma agri]